MYVETKELERRFCKAHEDCERCPMLKQSDKPGAYECAMAPYYKGDYTEQEVYEDLWIWAKKRGLQDAANGS